MGCEYYCYGTQNRSFLTKKEQVDLLKEYKDDLVKEAGGVAEKIERLEKE